MKTRFWKLMWSVGATILALAIAPGAVAQCGSLNKPIKPTGWNGMQRGAQPSLVRTAFDDGEREPSIVGMWHVVFTFSDGSVFDDAVVQWHPDGTEIMNSARPAQYGNFCMGIWKQTGDRQYFLNHIPWQGDDPTGQPEDGAQLLERVTLSQDGNSYTGTFTFTAYDNSGKPSPTFAGTIAAKRITPETPFSDLL
jgi:hypothetical protein